jgi:glycosyltransferase involved in cell wall biosynthesis
MVFTLDALPDYLVKIIRLNNLELSIRLIGQVPYQELLAYYKSVDALLFPSKIESFGLPLLEASCFGLPVIAADLPYAREVLENYSNKYFIDPDSTGKWVDAIQNYREYKKICHNDIDICENSWKGFFELANGLIPECSHD